MIEIPAPVSISRGNIKPDCSSNVWYSRSVRCFPQSSVSIWISSIYDKCRLVTAGTIVSLSNIADHFEPGEIASADNRGNLPLRFGQHRGVKDVVCLRVLPQITPDSFRQSPLHGATTGFNGILELPISVPIDRQPKHAHKST